MADCPSFPTITHQTLYLSFAKVHKNRVPLLQDQTKEPPSPNIFILQQYQAQWKAHYHDVMVIFQLIKEILNFEGLFFSCLE